MSKFACSFNGIDERCEKTSPVGMELNGAERITAATNRDFETTVGNWTGAGNHSIVQSSTYKKAGTYSGKITATGAGDSSTNYIQLLSSAFTVLVVGEKYVYELWTYGDTAGVTLGLTVGDKTITGKTIYSATPGTFKKTVFRFQATSSTINQPIRLYLSGAGSCYIDDNSFTQGFDELVIGWGKFNITADQRIFSRQNPDLWTIYETGAGKLGLYLSTASGNDDVVIASSQNINTGSWVLFAYTFDQAGEAKVFVNGLLGASSSVANLGKFSPVPTFEVAHYFAGHAQIVIGQSQIVHFTSLPADIETQILSAFNNDIPDTWVGGTVAAYYRWSGSDDTTFLKDETGNNNLTAVNITQADDQVLGDYPRPLKAVASGSAAVLFGRAYQGQGGASASGSAATAFGRVYQGSGTSVAGGSATTAFGRVYSATGGAVASGHAPFGKVYNFKWEHGGPDFKLGDLLLARRLDYDKAANKVTLMEVRGVVQTIDAEGEANLEIISGSEYLPFFGVGIEFVRVGNKIDPNRRGSIYLTSDDVAAPFMDVIDGVDDFSKLGALSTIKARLGRLSGITDANFGALTGYGLYTENAYLKGTIAGGAASALMTGAGYYANKAGDFRFGNPSTLKYIKFDVATGIVDIGSGVALQWASVTGAGKPADNATVGADWSTNVTGRPTNLVALGDIPGFIQSTYINSTEIKAPNITGNSILGGNIVASSGGTNTAGLTGEGSGDTAVRIWGGSTYANRANAPFRVTQGGKTYATDIELTGNITASSFRTGSGTGKEVVIGNSGGYANMIALYHAGLEALIEGDQVYGLHISSYRKITFDSNNDGDVVFNFNGTGGTGKLKIGTNEVWHAGNFNPSSYALTTHNHDTAYAAINHNHTGVYAPVSHSHTLADISNAGTICTENQGYTGSFYDFNSNAITVVKGIITAGP